MIVTEYIGTAVAVTRGSSSRLDVGTWKTVHGRRCCWLRAKGARHDHPRIRARRDSSGARSRGTCSPPGSRCGPCRVRPAGLSPSLGQATRAGRRALADGRLTFVEADVTEPGRPCRPRSTRVDTIVQAVQFRELRWKTRPAGSPTKPSTATAPSTCSGRHRGLRTSRAPAASPQCASLPLHERHQRLAGPSLAVGPGQVAGRGGHPRQRPRVDDRARLLGLRTRRRRAQPHHPLLRLPAVRADLRRRPRTAQPALRRGHRALLHPAHAPSGTIQEHDLRAGRARRGDPRAVPRAGPQDHGAPPAHPAHPQAGRQAAGGRHAVPARPSLDARRGGFREPGGSAVGRRIAGCCRNASPNSGRLP